MPPSPRTSSTLRKSPAIDCDPPSSRVDDDRTTSARAPCSESAAHAECSAAAWKRTSVRRRRRRRRPSSARSREGGEAAPPEPVRRGRLRPGDVQVAGHVVVEVDDGRDALGARSTWRTLVPHRLVAKTAPRPSELIDPTSAPRRSAPHTFRDGGRGHLEPPSSIPATTGVVVQRLGDRELIPPGTCDPSHPPRTTSLAEDCSPHAPRRTLADVHREAPVSALGVPLVGCGTSLSDGGYDRGAMPTEAPVLVPRPVDDAAPAECLHCSPPLTPAGVFVGRNGRSSHWPSCSSPLPSLRSSITVRCCSRGTRRSSAPSSPTVGVHRHALPRISFLGSTKTVLVLGTVLTVVTWRRCRALGVVALAAMLSRPLLEFTLKFVVDRERPNLDRLVAGNGPSFPSGHVMAAVALWGLVPLAVAL